jgi:hypothetical protein
LEDESKGRGRRALVGKSWVVVWDIETDDED